MRRRLMLKSSTGVSPVLPVEYQQVEWVGSDGYSFLITSIIPIVGDTYDIKFLSNTILNSMVFGERSSGTYDTSNDQVYLNFNRNNGLSFFSGQNTQIFQQNPDINIIYDLQVTVNSAYNGAATIPFYIFAINNMGTPAAIMNGKIYKFTGIRNSVKIFDFIPCYRKSDGVIGMFETVSRTFLTNAGTGAFTKGVDI